MALYDPVTVANMALSHCGISKRITALDQSAHLERVCSEWYPIARDEILSDYRWLFSRRQIALALVEENPNSDWLFSYTYPVDALEVVRLVSPLGIPDAVPSEWRLGMSDEGRLIYCNVEGAQAEIISFVNDPGNWPDALALAVSWSMAAYIGPSLKIDARKIEAITARAQFEKKKARGKDNRQQQAFERVESSYIRARR